MTTILLLVDEIKQAGLPPDTRELIDVLGHDLDVVLVAQCYLKPGHRARRRLERGPSGRSLAARILPRKAGEGDHPKDGGGGARSLDIGPMARGGQRPSGTPRQPPPPPSAVLLPREAGEDASGTTEPAPCEFYGFSAADFDAQVASFAHDVVARHRPQWVVAYGWENPQLVAALADLELPILLVLDHVERASHAEAQIYEVFRRVTGIVFGDASVRESLTTARWAVEARDYRVLDGLRRAPQPSPSGWMAALRRIFGGPTSATGSARVAALAAAIGAAGARCAEITRTALAARARDAPLIAAPDAFDVDLYLPAGRDLSKKAAIADYLRMSQLAVPRDRPHAGRLQRRPLIGFNPLIYATDNRAFDEASGEDPLAHFIRSGRPAGRWTHRVLRPRAEPAPAGIAAAIHGHFHYPDLVTEFLERLAENHSAPDLFLTTTSDERREAIARILEAAGIVPKRLATYPNIGRDVWPFVDLLRQGAFRPYAVVGHVHGKRSPHHERGAIWRDFLWSHLVGGPDAITDTVLAAFAYDPGLGLVFAEDPHLTGWEDNLASATALAARAGIFEPLPHHFDYPVGTMFWARPDALRPLLDLGLTLDDIPAEPLAEDGTVLHALERLIPFLVGAAGFTYATTHVAESRR